MAVVVAVATALGVARVPVLLLVTVQWWTGAAQEDSLGHGVSPEKHRGP